jgi:hypothetical protein
MGRGGVNNATVDEEDALERIRRARADVTEDDSERAERRAAIPVLVRPLLDVARSCIG